METQIHCTHFAHYADNDIYIIHAAHCTHRLNTISIFPSGLQAIVASHPVTAHQKLLKQERNHREAHPHHRWFCSTNPSWARVHEHPCEWRCRDMDSRQMGWQSSSACFVCMRAAMQDRDTHIMPMRPKQLMCQTYATYHPHMKNVYNNFAYKWSCLEWRCMVASVTTNKLGYWNTSFPFSKHPTVKDSRRPIFSRHPWPLLLKKVPNMEMFRALLERWGRQGSTIDAYIQGIEYFYSCLDNYVEIHGITNHCIRFPHFLSWLEKQRHLPTYTYKQQDLEKYANGPITSATRKLNALEAIQSN